MDRNTIPALGDTQVCASLSARRAWIEICFLLPLLVSVVVALRKESVDRNHPYMAPPYMAAASLSARRAWIEIPRTTRTMLLV